MVFGAGYAAADDVVAHELTHGYVERTSGLFYFHQSGAINESVSDVIGEIVDHRNPASTASDADWHIGEDLPGTGGERSLKNPTALRPAGPDAEPGVRQRRRYNDGGAVHDNDGVGNKTAYLISQGGTFNGRTMAASTAGTPPWPRPAGSTSTSSRGSPPGPSTPTSDASWPAPAPSSSPRAPPASPRRTATRWPRLSPPPSCPLLRPTPPRQPRGSREVPDGGQREHAAQAGRRRHRRVRLQLDLAAVGQGSRGDVPSYATSGKESLFGFDPDPELGDPASGSMTSAPFQVAASTGGTHLNFHHAYVMEWDGERSTTTVARWWSRSWSTASGPPSPDCPGSTDRPGTSSVTRPRASPASAATAAATAPASWTSPRSRARPCGCRSRIRGDEDFAEFGWWIDDIRLYSCADDVPGAPTVTKNAAGARQRHRDLGEAGVRRLGDRVVQDHPLRRRADDRVVRRAQRDGHGAQPDRTADRLGGCGERRRARSARRPRALLPDDDDHVGLDHQRHEGQVLHGDRQGRTAWARARPSRRCRSACNAACGGRPPGPA